MNIKPANRIEKVEEYYFSKKLTEIKKLNEQGNNILNLGVGNPDIPSHPDVLDSLTKAALHKGSNYYQSYRGLDGLRLAFSKWYFSTYNVQLNAESEILPLMGSKEGITHITMAFTNPGNQVLIPNPGYPAYTSVSKLFNLKIQYYNLKEKHGYLPELEELEKIVKPNCKIIWINYPNMPTGANGNLNNFAQIVEWAKSRNILIVHDNPYSLILNDKPISIFNSSIDKSHILELNSLSKSHNMAGWRVGMVAGSKQNIDHIIRVKSNFDSGMYKPIQEAAITALQLPKTWNAELNGIYSKRREIVWRILDLLHCEYNKDTAGLFVWAKIPDEFNSGEEFSDYLLYNHSLFITPGKVFGSNGEKYVRISLCADELMLNNFLNQFLIKKKRRA
ncbi:MAG: aminotransferase class I/II-fold pyridoxal phosphate-dependent enzyme [Chlorobi bacterium]|nr:aminotransferase class I/II-fold pyridoxal phosphate-dependent enzyme [Chlorobiota bacterium]